MNHNAIEKGLVLAISEVLTVSDDYTVYYHNIPVGNLLGNLLWFPQYSFPPAPSEIKQIVYLGDYKWGVKHLRSLHDEFKELTIYAQESILSDYLQSSKTFT